MAPPERPTPSAAVNMSHRRPLALPALDAIRRRLRNAPPALFLDFDGTLTPIVAQPDSACLSGPMRTLLVRLAAHCPLVAIVTGRDLADIRGRVALSQLFYLASHGFDIAGPSDTPLCHQPARSALPVLNRAERRLREAVAPLPGVELERKRFAIALHYRQAEPETLAALRAALDIARSELTGLRQTVGKKVIDFRPELDWDKGAAVLWLLEALELGPKQGVPLYIGDDETDEDAFRALLTTGVGILVAERPRRSLAHYRLRDPGEVQRFLAWLMTHNTRQ